MSLLVRPLLLVLVLVGAILPAVSQTLPQAARPQADRIATHPDLRATTRLAGHVPVWANAANDAGPASAAATLRLTFVLTRSPERQAAFNQLLADQQNPASPNYHHWLTPQQIGTLYGPTQNDLEALTNWLMAQSLPVVELAPSRIFVTVEAPASTVASALSTSFRNFNLRDPATGIATPHLAATVNPALPAAFAAIVGSIKGLVDTPEYPAHHLELAPMSDVARATPAGTQASSGLHYIAPADFTVLYDLAPAYNSGINGAGQKIAILGRSRVDAIDISRFENLSGLPATQPNVIVPPGAADPGATGTTPTSGTSPADQTEATLDVERVAATAPGAQVDLVIATSASGGVETAAQYEVQTLRDPVMNISFSFCEASAGSSGVSFWDTLFSQAAAEGISSFASSGDSGAAGCDTASVAPPAVQSLSINYICSSSFVTCVGGTEFADFASPSGYWNPTNGTNLESAIAYIPEGAWNESAASGGTAIVAGTGGGASTFITKPTWQTGTGVPADGFRDVPDISFSSSAHNAYFGCLNYAGADCSTHVAFFAGTSAAAPSMAGIAALLNQKTGTPQGNLNSLLYRLAAATPSAFHDATPATSGVALCSLNTSSMCNNSTPSPTSLTGGLAGYALATGYDQATGLGSLDVANFLTAYAATPPGMSVTSASSSLTLPIGATTGNTVQITLNSSAYSGPVSLGCAITFNGPGTALSLPLCSLSPSTLALTPNGTALSTLTLTTSLPSTPQTAVVAPALPPVPAFPHSHFSRIAIGSLFLFALYPASRYRRFLSVWKTLPAALLLAGLGALSACSGSSTPLSPNPLLISTSGTSITAASPSVFVGGTDTFSVSVVNNGFNNTVLPTGTVQFRLNGSIPLGTATLVNGAATSAPIVFNTPPGNAFVDAAYSGDGNFSPSTSTGAPITILLPGTTTGSYAVTITATTPNGPTATTVIPLTIQ